MLGRATVSLAPSCHGGAPWHGWGRLACADGTRAFVKASSSAHQTIADCYRDEARIVDGLPPEVPAPRLLWIADDGDWVVLCFDDVPQLPSSPFLRSQQAAYGAATLSWLRTRLEGA